MWRHPVRQRLGLVLVFASLMLLFVWGSVNGQGFRPGGRGMPRGPRPGPGRGAGMELVFTCSKCGAEVGRGKTPLDAPASCPACGARFINGGIGSGKTGPSNPGVPPGNTGPANPNNPPPTNPFPPVQPAEPVVPAQPVDTTSSNVTAPPPARGPSPAVILAAIAIVLLVLAAIGGTVLLVLLNVKGNDKPARRSRSRPRRPRYEDED